jgi:hypothetical protein
MATQLSGWFYVCLLACRSCLWRHLGFGLVLSRAGGPLRGSGCTGPSQRSGPPGPSRAARRRATGRLRRRAEAVPTVRAIWLIGISSPAPRITLPGGSGAGYEEGAWFGWAAPRWTGRPRAGTAQAERVLKACVAMDPIPLAIPRLTVTSSRASPRPRTHPNPAQRLFLRFTVELERAAHWLTFAPQIRHSIPVIGRCPAPMLPANPLACDLDRSIGGPQDSPWHKFRGTKGWVCVGIKGWLYPATLNSGWLPTVCLACRQVGLVA